MDKKGDMKYWVVLICTLVGILFLVIVIYRVVFSGGLLK